MYKLLSYVIQVISVMYKYINIKNIFNVFLHLLPKKTKNYSYSIASKFLFHLFTFCSYQ